MKLVFVFAALVAVAAAVPSSDIVPESTLLTEEASPEYNEAMALLQMKGANACDDLAKASEDEVKQNINAEQDLLNKMDRGADCPNEGQAGVTAAQKEEARANQGVKDAQTALNNANNANVNWGTSRFNSVKKGQCNSFYASNAYVTAEKNANAAKAALDRANGKVAEAKKAVANAKEAAKKAVVHCKCKAYKAMQSAHATKSQKAQQANQAAWTKAANLRCSLKGTPANKCSVPSMPKLTVPKMAAGVNNAACTEHANWGKLICHVTNKGSNKSGVIKPPSKSAHSLTGCGMHNAYRSWDKKAGFEELRPDGNHCRCDTGFSGAGAFVCYSVYCQKDGKPLTCTTTQGPTLNAWGVSDAKLPSGYTLTGGGIVNHYRHWNAKAGFEETYPNGNNWRGDMGFGAGHFTPYATGCKGLTCTTATKRNNGNGSGTVNCPSGYTVTGCGIINHHRKWDKKSGFEDNRPNGNGCFCDSGFGNGDNTCYARCCK